MRISDWSSDVCSSDLGEQRQVRGGLGLAAAIGLAGPAVEGGAVHRVAMPLPFRRFRRFRVSRLQFGNQQACGRSPALAGEQAAGQRRSEEHTSELQSLMRISYAVFCLKKKINNQQQHQ